MVPLVNEIRLALVAWYHNRYQVMTSMRLADLIFNVVSSERDIDGSAHAHAGMNTKACHRCRQLLRDIERRRSDCLFPRHIEQLGGSLILHDSRRRGRATRIFQIGTSNQKWTQICSNI